MKIDPYKSLDNVTFGMSRDEVRMVLDGPYSQFTRNEFSKVPTDSFDDKYLFVNYNADLQCESIEAMAPAQIFLFDKDLLKLPFDEALTWFKNLDPNIEVDVDGLTSSKFGVGLYAPDSDEEPKKPSESVIIFKKGYYD